MFQDGSMQHHNTENTPFHIIILVLENVRLVENEMKNRSAEEHAKDP